MIDTQQLPDNVLTTQLKKVVNWSRRSSLWPMPFATACCGIELMATASSRYDLARFGAEAMRFSPRGDVSSTISCGGMDCPPRLGSVMSRHRARWPRW